MHTLYLYNIHKLSQIKHKLSQRSPQFRLYTDLFEKLYKELKIVLYHGLKTPRSC